MIRSASAGASVTEDELEIVGGDQAPVADARRQPLDEPRRGPRPPRRSIGSLRRGGRGGEVPVTSATATSAPATRQARRHPPDYASGSANRSRRAGWRRSPSLRFCSSGRRLFDRRGTRQASQCRPRDCAIGSVAPCRRHSRRRCRSWTRKRSFARLATRRTRSRGGAPCFPHARPSRAAAVGVHDVDRCADTVAAERDPLTVGRPCRSSGVPREVPLLAAVGVHDLDTAGARASAARPHEADRSSVGRPASDPRRTPRSA